MRLHHVVVYRLLGASAVDGDLDAVSIDEPGVRIFLTQDMEPYSHQADVQLALANMLLTGLFHRDEPNNVRLTLPEKIAEIQSARREKFRGGVFLVVEVEEDSPELTKTIADMEDFGIVLDGLDKESVRERHLPLLSAIVAAAVLNLPENADTRVEKVTEVFFLRQGTKPTYALNFKLNAAGFSVARLTSRGFVESVGDLLPLLRRDKAIGRTLRLLTLSLEKPGDARVYDKFQAFIAAFSGLEIFINASYKSAYGEIWAQSVQWGESGTEDRPNLAQKFYRIAAILIPSEADLDHENFRKYLNARHSLAHGLDVTGDYLPTHEIQILTSRYLRAHLAYDAASSVERTSRFVAFRRSTALGLEWLGTLMFTLAKKCRFGKQA